MPNKFNLKLPSLLLVLSLLVAVPLATWLYVCGQTKTNHDQAVMADLPNGSSLGFAGIASRLALPMQLRHIGSIKLDSTSITDDAFVKLVPKLHELTRLESISLSNTGLSNDAILHLCKLRQLRRIDLRNTAASSEVIDELRIRLPDVELLTTEPVTLR